VRHSHPVNVLFVAAAGPRVGFGHLVRCGVLAGAMGVRARVALRAASSTRRDARALGWHVLPTMPTILRTLAPDMVIVDEPSVVEARRWTRAAAVHGIPSAAVRDLGLNAVAADLTIDGSLARAVDGPAADLQGPAFAILDPAIAELRRQNRQRSTSRVVIALGGGAHVRGAGIDVAARIRACRPDVDIALAPGFRSSRLPALPPGCRWIERHALRETLADATVAVVGGGMTLYEACALGTPIVTLAVVDAQRVTTSACAAAGAAIDASDSNRDAAVFRAASTVAVLIDAPDVRPTLGANASRLVDGQGTSRVAAHLRALLLTHPGGRQRHAA
jgi:spore coat polysaccharide biosynthesis predicted glycosyltransferase SpsG